MMQSIDITSLPSSPLIGNDGSTRQITDVSLQSVASPWCTYTPSLHPVTTTPTPHLYSSPVTSPFAPQPDNSDSSSSSADDSSDSDTEGGIVDFQITVVLKDDDGSYIVSKIDTKDDNLYTDLLVSVDLKRLSLLEVIETIGGFSQERLLVDLCWTQRGNSKIQFFPKIFTTSGNKKIEHFCPSYPDVDGGVVIAVCGSIVQVFSFQQESTMGTRLIDMVATQLHDPFTDNVDVMSVEHVMSMIQQLNSCYVVDKKYRVCDGLNFQVEPIVVESGTIIMEQDRKSVV